MVFSNQVAVADAWIQNTSMATPDAQKNSKASQSSSRTANVYVWYVLSEAIGKTQNVMDNHDRSNAPPYRRQIGSSCRA